MPKRNLHGQHWPHILVIYYCQAPDSGLDLGPKHVKTGHQLCMKIAHEEMSHWSAVFVMIK